MASVSNSWIWKTEIKSICFFFFSICFDLFYHTFNSESILLNHKNSLIGYFDYQHRNGSFQGSHTLKYLFSKLFPLILIAISWFDLLLFGVNPLNLLHVQLGHTISAYLFALDLTQREHSLLPLCLSPQ